MSVTRIVAPPKQALASGLWQDAAVTTTLLLAGIAAVKLLIQFAGVNHYGFFRDELYYMACGDHLAWGYVDQPPIIPFLIHVCRAVLGDSLRSIRFIPAMASSLLVVETAILAREFGGRRF